MLEILYCKDCFAFSRLAILEIACFVTIQTGLAVGDVMEILKAAELKKLALQVVCGCY